MSAHQPPVEVALPGIARPVHLLDSISQLAPVSHGHVVVSGSHGGTSAAAFVVDEPMKPAAVFYNDAGVGKDRAGIVALDLLQAVGVPCAVYSHASARIGDARDGLENGQITHVNALAAARGIATGMRVREAVDVLERGAG